MKPISMLINGERTQARGGATFERRNPLDGSVATTAPAATPQDAVAAVVAAAAAFTTWSQTGPGERRALLMKAAQALEDGTVARLAGFAADRHRDRGHEGVPDGAARGLAHGLMVLRPRRVACSSRDGGSRHLHFEQPRAG